MRPRYPLATTLGGELHGMLPLEPTPPASDVERIEHTRLRRRLLYGIADADCRAKVLRRLKSIERADAWGEPDLTGNLFSSVCRDLAVLYTPDRPRAGGTVVPTPGALPGADPPPPPPSGELVLDALAVAGHWDLMVRGQRDTIGMREWLERIDAIEDPEAPLGWGLAVRPAYADRVVVLRMRRDAPDLPEALAEMVLLTLDTGPTWVWEICDAGPEPYHEIRTALGQGGRVLYRVEGEAYPWWDRTVPARPRAVVPYSLYHAERTGHVWDPWEWREAVEGSLELVVQWTFYGHVILKAAWPQRYSVGVEWGGSSTEEDDDRGGSARTRQSIPADPAMVLLGWPSADAGEGSQPLIGQWDVSADPEKIAGAITLYERRVAARMGVNPAEVQRTSGDPRSGYALEVNRDAASERRDRYRPAFERGDLETIRIAACVLGSAAGVTLPTRGYGIVYGPPPPPPMPETGPDGPDGPDDTPDTGDEEV